MKTLRFICTIMALCMLLMSSIYASDYHTEGATAYPSQESEPDRNIICTLFGHTDTYDRTNVPCVNVRCRYVGDSNCVVQCKTEEHCKRCGAYISTSNGHWIYNVCMRDNPSYTCSTNHSD